MKLLSRIPVSAWRVVAAFVLGVLLGGCATAPGASAALVQRILDQALPPEFTGPAHVEHDNPYFHITIDATGLDRSSGHWEWKTLRYTRKGFVSRGEITLGADAK
jgi:hypothetical protein